MSFKSRFLDFNSFLTKVYENEDPNQIQQDASNPDANRVANEIVSKIKKNNVWIQIRKEFFGRLLSHLNVYGSSELDPPTMCTDGESIAFHPDFVKSQSNESLRFVIMHEILHCLNNHHERMGSRDPYLWNVACDYAINPLMLDENDKPLEGLDFPRAENGEREGLFEKKYEGMKAEDIYDDLIEEAKKSGKSPSSKFGKEMKIAETGSVTKSGKMPGPDGEYIVRMKEDEEGDEQEGDQPGEGEGQGGQPGEGEGQGGKPGEGEGEGQGGKGENKDGKSLPSVGDRVVLDNGQEATIKKVYSNGDIEV